MLKHNLIREVDIPAIVGAVSCWYAVPDNRAMLSMQCAQTLEGLAGLLSTLPLHQHWMYRDTRRVGFVFFELPLAF